MEFFKYYTFVMVRSSLNTLTKETGEFEGWFWFASKHARLKVHVCNSSLLDQVTYISFTWE